MIDQTTTALTPNNWLVLLWLLFSQKLRAMVCHKYWLCVFINPIQLSLFTCHYSCSELLYASLAIHK